MVPKVKVVCGFLEILLESENLYDLNISLADIAIGDCEKYIAQYSRDRTSLGVSLKLIFSAAAGKLIGRDMQIDAKTNLRLKTALSQSGEVESSKQKTTRWLSDQQFSEASYSSLARVQDFLKRMKLPILNDSVYEYSPPRILRNMIFVIFLICMRSIGFPMRMESGLEISKLDWSPWGLKLRMFQIT